MPQSLSLLIIRTLVFSSPKTATPIVSTKSLTAELYPYMATVVRNADCECYRVGGATDHIHLAIRLSRTKTVAKLIEELKTSSSKWLKGKSLPDFTWQRGYGMPSPSGPSDLKF